jgi:serine/threonine protein kinase
MATTTSDFTRLSRIGKGSYGVVYKAKIDDKIYAVKRNLTDDTTDFVGCIRELDILLRLNHPNIVILEKIIYDKEFPKQDNNDPDFKDDNIHFGFEMCKFDLHKMIYYQQIPVQTNKKLMIDILLGIEYIHSRGIIHRDMKPSNVLISYEGEEKNSVPIAKLCDFNLSKPFTIQGVNSPKIITSCYRPPEIVDGKLYDMKVDIWSIGCIFYEMVTRKRIVSGYKDNEIMREIQKMLKKTGGVPFYAQFIPKEYKDILPLFENIFTISPEKRWNSTQLLKHHYFDDQREYINQVQSKHPLCPPNNTIIKIADRKDRDEGAKIFIKSLTEFSKSIWYRHRTFFMAIDIFERYMIWCEKNHLPNYQSEELTFVVYICLYIAIKYYSIMNVCPEFNQIGGDKYSTPEYKQKGQELELKILDEILDFKIYRKTVYEAADELTDRLTIGIIQALFEAILCHPNKVNGKDVKEITKSIIQHLQQKK